MGRAIARLAAGRDDLEVVGGLNRENAAGAAAGGYPRIATLAEGADLVASADVVVDFSAPAFLAALLRERGAELAGRALVVGTTGLGAEEEALLEEASRSAAVLTAANFSVGVNLLLALAERAAAALGEEYDVEVVEAHHRRKEDAPSGTALALGEAVARGRGVELASVRRDGRSGRPGARPPGEIGFHALRGGEVVGDHRVLFLGPLDRVELAHAASDRDLFADGALRAARWLAGKPAGRYTVRDALGLS
jgi:4-hydroxy-tetrahydrodipicolinate reductase